MCVCRELNQVYYLKDNYPNRWTTNTFDFDVDINNISLKVNTLSSNISKTVYIHEIEISLKKEYAVIIIV